MKTFSTICTPLVFKGLLVLFLSTSALVSFADAAEITEGKRFALLIGNSEYTENALINPEVDVELIGAQLRKIGFDVTTVVNATTDQIDDSVIEFGKRARDSALRLFYYSGHGMSHLRDEYLIPVDFDFDGYYQGDRDPGEFLKRKSLSLRSVLGQLEKSKKGSNLLMFDACRTVAAKGQRGVTRVERISGASSSSARPDTLFFYSTKHETPALDGIAGEGSLFAQAVSKALDVADTSESLSYSNFKLAVTRAVFTGSKGDQEPWSEGSQINELLFWSPNPALAVQTGFKALLEKANSATMHVRYCKVASLSQGQKLKRLGIRQFFGKEGEELDRPTGWQTLASAAEHCDPHALLEMARIADREGAHEEAMQLATLASKHDMEDKRLIRRIQRNIKKKLNESE